MTTELMFNAVWKKLDTAQLVGLLSCLVPCHEKDVGRDDDVPVPRELASAVEILQSFAKDICAVTNVRPLACLRNRHATLHARP